MFAELREVVRQMHAAGVTLLTGTDTAMTRLPGFSLHDEIGLSGGGRPVSDGGLACGDFVVLAANPLEDISNTQRIDAVALNGVLLDGARLDELFGGANGWRSRTERRGEWPSDTIDTGPHM